MDLTTALQQNSLIYNSKGGMYHHSSFNANLDNLKPHTRLLICEKGLK